MSDIMRNWTRPIRAQDGEIAMEKSTGQAGSNWWGMAQHAATGRWIDRARPSERLVRRGHRANGEGKTDKPREAES